jgi:hypothetical protein
MGRAARMATSSLQERGQQGKTSAVDLQAA